MDQMVIESVKRMQEFDAATLARESDLGARFSLVEAVEPAKKLVRLYNQLSLNALDDFPEDMLTKIKQQADADFNRFQSLLDYAPDSEQHPAQVRETLVKQVQSSYKTAFNTLHMAIAYGVSKSTDFQRLENEARASIQSVTDQVDLITKKMESSQKEAEGILLDVRKVAAEQGVSQQAIYFKDESGEHRDLAETWKGYTIRLAIAVGVYAVFALFLHKIPWLRPENSYESLQLAAGKILIFFVLTYMLFLSAKNFLNHKHNEIVNRHRQNALMTFQALADAAKGEQSRDIVLSHAASCIFTPQETGYIKQSTSGASSTPSFVETLPKVVLRADKEQ